MEQIFQPQSGDPGRLPVKHDVDRHTIYIDADDQSRHMHNIQRLADELTRSVQEVTPVYEDVLMDLKSSARIHDYLPVLVSKNVKQLLKNHH